MNDPQIEKNTNTADGESMSDSMTVEAIRNIATASDAIITNLQANNPVEHANTDPLLAREKRRYSITAASRMVNKTVGGIRKAGSQGSIPEAPKLDSGRSGKFTLSEVNDMRRHWNCKPGKRDGDSTIRMSFPNFKGGVGKTTSICHFAQYLAQMGYRVLVVDADSQGSASITFGFKPDRDIDTEHTLYPYLVNEADSLDYAIRETHWEGIDLIPACLGLYSAEYALAEIAGKREKSEDWLSRLSFGLETIENNYDVILIDPPPALGMISLSVLRALDGLIIPTPPAMYDFHSTSAFFHMLHEVMESLTEVYGEEVELDFVKLMISKKQAGYQAHETVHEIMNAAFGKNLLNYALVQSAEINNASNEWKTVYDLDGPISSRSTYKRCIDSLDNVFGEIEQLIRAVWASRRAGQILDHDVPEQHDQKKQSDIAVA